MSKIARYQGNVRAFASNAQGMERTVFGGTNQADDLTSQITASFLRGWGIVGASEHPSLEDFNAAMYAMSQFIAYQHQMGVPEWHAEQEYHIGSICTHNGESYQSLQNANIGSQPPSAKWTPVLTSKNGLANLQLGEAAKRAVGNSTNQIPDMSFFTLSMGQTGYQKLPSGMIIQWGTVAMDGNGNAFATLPIAFPQGIHGGIGTEASPTGWAANSCIVAAVDITQSTRTVIAVRARSIVGTGGPTTSVSGVSVRYFCWGY
ncbi:carbohydrate-binding protein [Citrobacter europaeus]|uniref:gp53-like domain-containing protein n=1 Tax=Citrobacter europaeus TaxID=1914243 RepID=UPI0028BD6804|nr:carbohydrate-binding protein [Citrobacter europaeus]MDT7084454.1 carbohydrate-binding protein [Citrobacter europaeus]